MPVRRYILQMYCVMLHEIGENRTKISKTKKIIDKPLLSIVQKFSVFFFNTTTAIMLTGHIIHKIQNMLKQKKKKTLPIQFRREFADKNMHR